MQKTRRFDIAELLESESGIQRFLEEVARNRLDPPCLAQAASAADANDGTGFPLRRAAMTFAR